MGQKPAATQEQASSSSEEEEVSSEQEKDSSEEEGEQEQNKRTEPSVRPPSLPPKSSSTAAQPDSSSDDEEEEGSSEEEEDSSEEEPKQTEPSKKPTGAAGGSQKQPVSSESGSSKSQPSHSFQISDRKKNKRIQPSVTPVRSTMNSASENSCPTNDSRGVKRKLFQHRASDIAPAEERIPQTEKSSVEPKKLFQRVWSEEDEIALLKGVSEYWEKNGADPCKYQDAFHGFIKESLNVNFSKSQLIDKIRRLKKKYENNARKGKNGQDPKLSNGHEEESYELSKKIWATEGTSGGAPKPKPNITTRIQQPSQKAKMLFRSLNAEEVAEMNKFLGISEWHVDGIEKGLQLVEASKREELREKLNNLKFTAVLKSIVKRAQLMNEEANLVWEAVKSSRDQ